MTLERKAISTEPIKEKLKNLREHMPEQPDHVYSFASYLADRLNPELIPVGFNMATELVLYDLQEGVSGFPHNNPIPSNLVGYPPMIYATLRMQVPDIADAVCPEDFAQGVRAMYDEVNKRL